MKGRAAAVFVFGTLAVMTGAALWLVGRYARNCPYGDDWEIVPWATHHTVKLQWLFAQHNEHRIPLIRLLLLGLLQISNLDFRVGCYANVAFLLVAAALFVLLARQLRGRIAWTDAFFPLVLLGWGHWSNFVSDWQLQYTLPLVLFAVALCLAWAGKTALLATLTILLASCGANGFLLAAPLVGWMLGTAIVDSRWPALLAGVVCFVALALLCPRPSGPSEVLAEGPSYALRNCLGFLSHAFLPPYVPVAPPYGVHVTLEDILFVPETAQYGSLLRTWVIGEGVASLLVSAAVVLAVRAIRRDWRRGLVLTGALAGSLTLALAVGLTRRTSWEVQHFRGGGLYDQTSRYALLFAPLPITIYLLAAMEPHRFLRSTVQVALLVCAVIGAVAYVPPAIRGASDRAAAIDSFVADAQSGASVQALVRDHAASVYTVGRADAMPQILGYLHDHRHPSVTSGR